MNDSLLNFEESFPRNEVLSPSGETVSTFFRHSSYFFGWFKYVNKKRPRRDAVHGLGWTKNFKVDRNPLV